MKHEIVVKGAREQNLKNIDITIPRNQFVVMTGLSGSGKSSLAFETIYKEGQRRYVESLSAYARQFLGNMEKPDVDSIEGLSPAISIDQKTTNRNPRSTVGTVTEIYDYLRLLFARIGRPVCPTHSIEIQATSATQMVDRLLAYPERTKMQILAPVVSGAKGTHVKVFEKLRNDGYVRVRINKENYDLEDVPKLEKNKKHSIEVVVDRIALKEGIRSRLSDSIETSLKLGEGKVIVLVGEDELVFSEHFACPHCDFSVGKLEPRMFSFNSPFGACSCCSGLGVEKEIDIDRVIADPSKSINEGAIKGWDNPHAYQRKMLDTTCAHYAIDLDRPFELLTKKEQDTVLYGSDDEIFFKLVSDNGAVHEKVDFYEGVIGNLERRYLETSSSYIREWIEGMMSERLCRECGGKRLSIAARSILINGMNISRFTDMSIKEAHTATDGLSLTEKEALIANLVLKEIKERLSFLINVGLDYLTLDRSAGTLSGGESQRIRLATQIGSRLSGVLYVLDEPSIGLHQRDNDRLIETLKSMRDLGNTLIVVEHDEDTMLACDHLIDIGPRAGIHGGEIVAQGTPGEVMQDDRSLTGRYLAGKEQIFLPDERKQGNGNFIKVVGAKENNLKNVTLKLPMGVLNVISGVSGSGKSTLINQVLYPAFASKLYRLKAKPGRHKTIQGEEHVERMINIDQSPIGRTPRSNPATYTGVFDDIRDLFAATNEAKVKGYAKGRFSFNVKGGRCGACNGDGVLKIEMHFLPDVYVECEECKGSRYNKETLEVKYRDKNIADVLKMTAAEALDFFQNHPKIARKLQTIVDVGLDYIHLGQPASTLSGGEAQRVKLAAELHRKITDKTVYILDEPTTGLHVDDVKRFIKVIERMVEEGATIIIIEHNLDVIKMADYVVDLGPEGGNGGGMIIAQGTPEEVSEVQESYTGKYLKKLLERDRERQK
ncbi:MAG: excinuclease ABC subunit UvrA [Defluviitaleaceae bacterium]|nr:excinuclease ABC subunit UvrA [Defluviitaleaceae bacterium]